MTAPSAFARQTWLISKTIWIEAIRRKEVYAIVAVAAALIGAARLVHFFDIEGLSKFYREAALKTMNVATALTVILLAARQLPRELENRTIYPILAKPVARGTFLVGKFLGVVAVAAFCYSLFMAIFIVGHASTGAPLHWPLFAQSVYLQMWSFAAIAALTLMLSLLFNVDAAVTLAALLYLCSQVFMSLMSYIHDYLEIEQQRALLALHYIFPQLTLFDASAKVVHSVPLESGGWLWESLGAWAIVALTVYGFVYTALYLGLAHLMLRRRAF